MNEFVDFIMGFLMIAFMLFLIVGFYRQKHRQREEDE